uniref:Uncharacterized protein n=1 Tax=Arundo donax TaxID=35708 RepID=A0A0A9A795_ARUDO
MRTSLSDVTTEINPGSG